MNHYESLQFLPELRLSKLSIFSFFLLKCPKRIFSLNIFSSISSDLTCPVWPCGMPVMGGAEESWRGILLLIYRGDKHHTLVVVAVTGGTTSVTITPAEVPTHNMSLTARSEVTRRQAVLCWMKI